MADSQEFDEAAVRAVCRRHEAVQGALLPILHDVQARFGYVPDPAIRVIADELNFTRAEVYGTLSFYHDFQREPQRRHSLRVCRSEACQAVGGREVWSAASRAAENSDGDIQLQAVYCLGNCACAPSAQLDGRTLGRMNPERVTAIFSGASPSGVAS